MTVSQTRSLSKPVRLKARGLVQHGGPTGWLEERDLAGGGLVRDGRAVQSAFSIPTGRLTGAAQLRILLSFLPCVLPRIPLMF